MFRKTVVLFRLFGLRVRADASWVLLAVLVSWSLVQGVFGADHPELPSATLWAMGVAGTVLLFASILVHEFCHALAARRFGMPVRDITLFIFGGVTDIQERPPSPAAEAVLSGAGPAASAAVALGLFSLAGWGRHLGWGMPARAVIGTLATINLVLAVFNLVPAFPLDGGRVLRAGLWHFTGDLRGSTRAASIVGELFGALLVIVGVSLLLSGMFLGGLWWALIGLFLRSAASRSFEELRARQALEGVLVQEIMTKDPVSVPPTLSVHDLVVDHMYREHYKIYPVTENGRLEGCVTPRHVGAVDREEWSITPVEKVAVPCDASNTVRVDEEATSAWRAMNGHGTSRMIVIDEQNRPVGVLALKDLFNVLSIKLDLQDGKRQL